MMKFPKYLRIAFIDRPIIIRVNKTIEGEYVITGGPEGKLIEMLAQALKFSYKLLRTPDGEWGSLKDGKWSGGIGMVYRNETDMAISKFGVFDLRSQYIHYSFPYSLEDLTFGTRKPGLRPPNEAFVRPFTFNMWIAIILAVMLMAVLFSFIQNIHITDSLLQVTGLLISQSINLKYTNFKNKLIIFSWALGTLFLSFSYKAVLLSFLTIPLMEIGPEDVDSLSTAVAAGTYKAMTFKGTMHLSDLLNSKRERIQIIGRHIQDNNHFIEPRRKPVQEVLLKEKMALICPRDILQLFLQNDFFESKDTFKLHTAAIVMSKNFCCKNEVDYFVQILLGSGLYQKAVSDEIFLTELASRYQKRVNADDFESSAKPLSKKDVADAFTLIAIGHALATILVLIEIIYSKCFCKQKAENNERIKGKFFRDLAKRMNFTDQSYKSA